MDTIQAALQATTEKLILVILVVSLPGIIALLRDVYRTRRERLEHKDSSRDEARKAREEADARRDGIMQGFAGAFARQADTLTGLTTEIGNMVRAELERNEIRQRADQGHDKAIIGNTQAIGDLVTQTSNLRKGVSTVSEQVSLIPKQMANEHGTQIAHFDGKIDTALSKAGSMLDEQFDAVQKELNDVRETLKDIQEKVSHIPELEQCLNQTNRALLELADLKSRLITERDAAVGELASSQVRLNQQIMHNAKLSGEKAVLTANLEDLRARHDAIILPADSAPAEPREGTPLADRPPEATA